MQVIESLPGGILQDFGCRVFVDGSSVTNDLIEVEVNFWKDAGSEFNETEDNRTLSLKDSISKMLNWILMLSCLLNNFDLNVRHRFTISNGAMRKKLLVTSTQ